MLASFELFALAAVAVLILGISKGGFGGALNIIAMPILALVLDPRYAAALILPILCLFDLMALRVYRKKGDAKLVKVMLLGAIFGIAIGTLSFKYLDENGVRLILGIIAFVFGLRSLLRYLLQTSSAGKQLPSWMGSIAGLAAGFTSFVAHTGAPPVQMYLLPMRLDKTVLHATIAIFFAILNFTKLVPYAWLGQFDSSTLLESAYLLPFVPLGFYLGVWLHKRISERYFYLTLYSALLLMGTKLTYDGINGILT